MPSDQLTASTHHRPVSSDWSSFPRRGLRSSLSVSWATRPLTRRTCAPPGSICPVAASHSPPLRPGVLAGHDQPSRTRRVSAPLTVTNGGLTITRPTVGGRRFRRAFTGTEPPTNSHRRGLALQGAARFGLEDAPVGSGGRKSSFAAEAEITRRHRSPPMHTACGRWGSGGEASKPPDSCHDGRRHLTTSGCP